MGEIMLRRVAFAAGAREHPGDCRMKRLEGRQPRPFTAVSIAGGMAIYEAGIKRAQLLPSHAQALHRAEPHIVVNHVGPLDEFVDNSAAFFVFEVDCEALLAAL